MTRIGYGRYIHGMKGSRPYRAWRNMKERCLNPKNKNYHHYGGRGIIIDEKWLDFVGFWNDMKTGYQDNLTLDRKDVNGNYCKENCRWITLQEQAANKRNSILYNGECARQAGLRINKNPSLVYQRINAGWTIHDSFTKPSRRPK